MRYKPSKKEGKPHIFAKKVVCSDCGGRMHKINSRYKDRDYTYLRCDAFNEHGKIKFADLENLVAERLRRHFAEINSEEVAEKISIQVDNAEPLKQEFAKVESELGKQTEYLKNIYQDKVNGLLDDDEFLNLKSDFTTEQARLKKRKEILNEQISNIVGKQNTQIDKVALVEKFKNFEKLDRQLVDKFVEQIKIAPKVGNAQNITINWAI